MKTIRLIITLFAVLSLVTAAVAQEAIPTFVLGGPVGYANNGAGYAFSPLVNIDVTALGFGGSDITNNPYQVSLFDATGNQVATASVSGASTLFNQTYYQGIAPVMLTAGATYFIGAAAPGTGLWVGNVVGGGYGGSLSVNPDISYLQSETGFMPPGGSVPGESPGPSVFFVDENFQFQVAPEPAPALLGLMGVVALLGMTWHRRRGGSPLIRACFEIQFGVPPLGGSAWEPPKGGTPSGVPGA